MDDLKRYEIPEMRRIKRIHFVGIGGAGMCGIAEVLLNQGYEISGSDIRESSNTERLTEMGAQIFIGHESKNHGASAARTVYAGRRIKTEQASDRYHSVQSSDCRRCTAALEGAGGDRSACTQQYGNNGFRSGAFEESDQPKTALSPKQSRKDQSHQ